MQTTGNPKTRPTAHGQSRKDTKLATHPGQAGQAQERRKIPEKGARHPDPAPAAFSNTGEVPAMPEVKPAGGGSEPAREERLARLIAEIQEGRMGAMRTAKALAAFAWTTGEKLRGARELVGGDAFIDWLPRALGLPRHEAAALFHFSKLPKFDASPARAMTLSEALDLVAVLCDEYQQWPKTSGGAAKPKAPRPSAKPR